MSIFVWIETSDGKANSASWEALGAAKSLAGEFNTDVTAVIFGKGAADIASEAGNYGAAKALVCADESLNDYRLETYASLLSHLVTEHAPKAVIGVATSNGRELLASSAADTNSGMISEATELSTDGDSIIVVKPAYAGKVKCTVKASGDTTYITIRGRAFPVPEKGTGSADTTTVAPVIRASDVTTQIENVTSEASTVSLTDAAIVVSGGRGMANNPESAPADTEDETIWKAKAGYADVIQPLADVLGAAVGASRAAVDAGYIPYEHQVGQTGKVVNPDLYIAAGISGAIQHQAGMRGSKIIVAINKDGDAPIFKLARYGIVEDLYDFLPALTAELKKRLGK